jgi:hypothetical protein
MIQLIILILLVLILIADLNLSEGMIGYQSGKAPGYRGEGMVGYRTEGFSSDQLRLGEPLVLKSNDVAYQNVYHNPNNNLGYPRNPAYMTTYLAQDLQKGGVVTTEPIRDQVIVPRRRDIGKVIRV